MAISLKISFRQHLKCSSMASSMPGILDRAKKSEVESSFSRMLNTSMAQDDSAKSPDLRHISRRHASMSATSLLVNFLLLVTMGFVASTEFLGKVISFFSIFGTTFGLAGVTGG